MDTLFEIGLMLNVFLQGLGSWLTPFMQFFTSLGEEEFFLLIVPVVFWCASPGIGLRMGLLLLISSGLSTVFKLVIHGPRPYWTDPRVIAFTAESSFGAPSGHSTNAASVWGGLAHLHGKKWVWLAVTILVFLIGVSRVYMGVHFPHDVLLGWFLGAVVLLAFLKLEKPVAAWLNGFALPAQVGIVFAASVTLVLSGVLARLLLGSWELPPGWVAAAVKAAPEAEPIHPLSLSDLVSHAGALLGLGLGVLWLPHVDGFDSGGPLLKRATRVVLGFVGVLLIWRGLGMLLPDGEDAVSCAFRYLRYALLGLWISALGPMMFTLLRLAERSPGALKVAGRQPGVTATQRSNCRSIRRGESTAAEKELVHESQGQ